MCASPKEANVRRRVIYAGRVQGVGFRYTTRMIADSFPVVGFVKNLDDGTVELQAEGARAAVDDFLAAVARRFQANLRDTATNDIAPRGSEPSFDIAY